MEFFRPWWSIRGGVQAERLDDYGKLYSLFRELLAPSYTQDELHIGSGKTGDTLGATESKYYQMPIMSGLTMTSEKGWPLSKCPIVLDFSLVDSSSEWLQGTTSSFEISQVCVEGDVIQLDPSIDEALTKKLLQGGSLNVPITS